MWVAAEYQLKYKYFSHICTAKKYRIAYKIHFPSMVIGPGDSGLKVESKSFPKGISPINRK